ncbi:MAG: hypothetical protein ACUVTL_08925 [Thermoproteota archaeon]
MKSLNLRFVEAHIEAMENLVSAGLYSSVADVVRAAVRDLLLREYFGREAEIEHMIVLHGGRREKTYGKGDKAKSHRGPKKLKAAEPLTQQQAKEAESEAEGEEEGIGSGSIAIGTTKTSVTIDRDRGGA